MMKVLFAVDSVFQLMMAINLRLTLYRNDKADIIIYDSTLGARESCEKIAKTNIFSKCFFAKTSLAYCGKNYTKKQKLQKYLIYFKSLFFADKVMKEICPKFDGRYDVFLFNGIGALPECIYNVTKRQNSSIKCYRFEDSYLSYTQNYGSKKGKVRKFLEKIADLFGRENIEDDIRGYYFAAPDLVQYKFSYPIFQAPKFERSNIELKNVLNYVFDFEKMTDEYTEKYIFFECGDAFYFGNQDDLRYVEKLISIVGGNNVLIKRHPRILENRFEKYGVHIAQGARVPWELIQLNVSLSEKVFITTKSAAALTSELYFGDKCSVVVLYKGVKGEQGPIGENFEKYMDVFEAKSKNEFWRPSNIEEFEEIIRKIEDDKK